MSEIPSWTKEEEELITKIMKRDSLTRIQAIQKIQRSKLTGTLKKKKNWRPEDV
jgi:hypothetical protein